MTSRREPRLADAAEIAAEQGLTPARILRPLHRARGKRGRRAVPRDPRTCAAAPACGTTQRSRSGSPTARRPRLQGHAPPSRDPEELLNAADASRFLGYKNPNQVTTYMRDHPGYFPDPDVVEEMGTDENPYRRQKWRVQTLLDWMATRPGRGRRAGVDRGSSLPDVPVDGDPDELLGAMQAAALLGYKTVGSFSTSLSQGKLPLLETTDGIAENAGRQNGRRRWTRRRILEQAAQQETSWQTPTVSALRSPPHERDSRLGSWSLAGRMSHDGRHGVARHHAPQQQMLLRTGHRQSSSSDAGRSPQSRGRGRGEAAVAPTTKAFLGRDLGRGLVVGGWVGG